MHCRIWLLLSLLALCKSCGERSDRFTSPLSTIDEELMTTPVKDLHSYADPDKAVMQHLNWEAVVDFDSSRITGRASIRIARDPTAKFINLDTKSLLIEKVTLGTKGQEIPAKFELGVPDEILGRKLKIPILKSTEWVNIYYRTTAQSEALQWLSPEQTAGKIMPFLFTQSQAILARSWIPLQDSPGIRFTYNAEVSVPTGMMALMSASNPVEKNSSGIYNFTMNQAIPAYLMALAVGDMVFESLGPRSGVYGEPETISAAHYEFQELEQMLSAAEELYGPYLWDRYDILVLPPSFPFGGMENPRLTFATPTILAGDRSLTSLIAHELAHSWSGNLVTNATWEDFWLNEGFTVYFEQRIMEALYGRSYADMLALLALDDLKKEVEEMKNNGQTADTRLKLDLKQRNPDDGVTAIAYDKGYYFLRWLEERTGREKWDDFLRDYFQTYAFRGITTAQFLNYLQKYLIEKHHINIYTDEINAWVYQPGLPETLPEPHSTRLEAIRQLLKDWDIQKFDESIMEGWSTPEWLYFIRNIPQKADSSDLALLDNLFNLTQSGNSEILVAWFLQGIKRDYQPVYDRLDEFLKRVGRRKFLVPLYQAIMATPDGPDRARELYAQARPNYHFVSSNSIDQLLDYRETGSPQSQ